MRAGEPIPGYLPRATTEQKIVSPASSDLFSPRPGQFRFRPLEAARNGSGVIECASVEHVEEEHAEAEAAQELTEHAVFVRAEIKVASLHVRCPRQPGRVEQLCPTPYALACRRLKSRKHILTHRRSRSRLLALRSKAG